MSGSLGGLLDPTQRSTGLGGLLDNPPRPLQITPPSTAPNTDLASAVSQTAQTTGDWLAQQQQQSADMGLWDPARGMPTQAGWQDAANKYIQGVLLRPKGELAPRLPRIGIPTYRGQS